MLRYSGKRFLLALLVAFTVSLVNFALLFYSGDLAVALAGENATEEQLQTIREEYGYDRPILLQYVDWLHRVLGADFGESVFFQIPVIDLIASRLPVTLTLGALAVALAILIALPLGVVAAIRPNGLLDRIIIAMSVFIQAVPSFWMGLVAIVLFALTFPIFPPSGSDEWLGFVLPTLVLGINAVPALLRVTRSGMLEVLSSDYIRTARAKGASEPRVLFKHALRNALVPVVSLAAVQFGYMLSGSIVVETVFGLNGTGFLAWEAIRGGDLPTVQAILLLFSSFYIILTFLADLLNAWVDPRIRVS